jgi:hypothetical protein
MARPSQDMPLMVFAVQCPNPKCRKYMLVEERDRGKVVACLLCRSAIKVGGGTGPTPPPVRARPAPKS